jgi:hypothetical protein
MVRFTFLFSIDTDITPVAGDDAEEAGWYRLSFITEEMMAFDHYQHFFKFGLLHGR